MHPAHPIGQFQGQLDIGTVQPPGTCRYEAGPQAYRIASSGTNIWGERDDFHFVWRRMDGNFIATARVEFLGAGGHAHRKLGWMARAGLEPDAPHVCVSLHGDGLVALQYRRTPGSATEQVRTSLNGADVLQLERQGDTFILSAAKYGEPFTVVRISQIALAPQVQLGLFVCAHSAASVEEALFQDVRLVAPAAPGFERGRDPFGSRLEVLEVESGHRTILYSEDTVFEAPNWTRDGLALIYNQAGRLYRFDLATGKPARIDTAGVVRNNNDHVLSFDGKNLAISSHSPEGDFASQVYTLPVTGGTPQLITPLGPSYLHGWSPDGKYLVYTGQRNGQYDIYRIPAGGGAELQLTDTVGLDDGPEYTPDGKTIYFNSVRSGRMQIWRMKPDGRDPQQLTEDEYNNWFPHISPDGRWVVFLTYLVGEVEPSDHPAARRVYLRRMPIDGGAPTVLAYLYGGQGTLNVPSWSPDGRRLAFVSNTVPFEGN